MATVYEAFDLNDRTQVGRVIANFTVDFCRTLDNIAVSQTGMTLTELGTGKYVLMNPNITARTVISLYLTADSTVNATLMMDPRDGVVTSGGPSIGSSGRLTYLQLVNAVLRRITQPALASDVSSATGQAKIIADMINEAQNELWAEANNWNSLYTTRTFNTVVSQATYAVSASFGRTIDLMDTTNGIILKEDNMRAFDENDPDSDYTGNPTHFAMQGEYYTLYPIPSAIVTIRERYWKIPDKLVNDEDLSDLPLFCENFIIHWTWMSILQYLQKYEAADRIALKIYGNPAMKDPGILQKAKLSNEKLINQMFRLGGNNNLSSGYNGISSPRFPSNYGRNS